MVFSSMTFLCVFLPVVFLLYSVLPSIPVKNGLLIIASLLFYAYGEPKYVLLMIFSIVMNYLFGRLLDSENERLRRMIVGLAVCVNLALLFVFKYLDMVLKTVNQISHSSIPMANLALPIGIFFFTFQALSYVIDVYRRDVEAEKNLFHVMLYISFFPQLIAGPIVKYHDIQEQIRSRKTDSGEIAAGMRRFILGLAKKVLISNVMAVTADALFAAPMGEMNILSAWTAAIAYLFQIYFDFSGYSDMAIGMGRIFGFTFQENFRYPYISQSIQEFWRRWHISLSTWFKEYLYIPLGGNRKGKVRTCVNKLIVFFSTGLWHGADWTFVIWGLWHGMFMLLEEVIPVKKLPRLLRHVYTLLVVVIGFVMFRADTFTQGIQITGKMFAGWSFQASQMNLVLQQMTPLFILTVIIAVIACMPVLKWVKEWGETIQPCRKVMEPLGYLMSLILLVLCILSLSSGTYNPFIYFRF